jgi:hypothetical protein
MNISTPQAFLQLDNPLVIARMKEKCNAINPKNKATLDLNSILLVLTVVSQKPILSSTNKKK